MSKTVRLVTYLVRIFFKLCFFCRENMLHITHLELLITSIIINVDYNMSCWAYK